MGFGGHGNAPSKLHKLWGISGLAEDVLGPPEELCYMVLII
jgi:hypothetical protein